MSERGSVASQYFYCRACCEATIDVFEDFYEYTTAVQVPREMSNDDKPYPIIVVAKSHTGYPGEEVDEFENEVAPVLAARLCHRSRFAIIPDQETDAGVVWVEPNMRAAEKIVKALT